MKQTFLGSSHLAIKDYMIQIWQCRNEVYPKVNVLSWLPASDHVFCPLYARSAVLANGCGTAHAKIQICKQPPKVSDLEGLSRNSNVYRFYGSERRRRLAL